MIDTKTRLLAVAGSLILLLLIVDLVRRRKLKEEYSVLWVGAAVGLLIMASWVQLLTWITTAIGGVTLSSTIFFFALLFVFLVLLHYSVRISSMERRMTALVQEMGLVGVEPRRALAGGAPTAAEPRCAVIIPCFNDGEVLPDAVSSIKEREPVEVVVVDDGSTEPATIRALDVLAKSGITVIHRENGGLGAARTTGLGATTAPFVFPLDADDELEPGALADMADALERDPQAGFAWGDYELFGDQSGRYRAPDAWLPWTLTYVNPYPVCSMFRRQTLERAGGWQGRAYEDWDLWLRLIGLKIEGIRVDRSVYRRRLHGDARLLQEARRRHQELFDALQTRNAGVFASRATLRRRETPATWKIAVYPVVFGPRKFIPLRLETFMQRTMMRRGSGLP